jgi:hypothetical protein
MNLVSGEGLKVNFFVEVTYTRHLSPLLTFDIVFLCFDSIEFLAGILIGSALDNFSFLVPIFLLAGS